MRIAMLQLGRFALASAGLTTSIGFSYLYFTHGYPFVSDYLNAAHAPDVIDVGVVFCMLATYGVATGLILWVFYRLALIAMAR